MFTGFDSPNYTQTPNDFFDHLLRDIEDLSELKVTLIMIRHTFGFHKEKAELSISYLVTKTGMTEKSVKRGIKLALERGTVRVAEEHTPTRGTVYEIVIKAERDTGETPPPVTPKKKTNKKKTNSTDFSLEKSVKEELCVDCGKPYDYSKHIRYGNDLDNPVKHEFVPPVSGGSGMSYEEKLENALGEGKKPTVFAPRTPKAKYLAENMSYGKSHWDGFPTAKLRKEFERLESERPAELESAIKWAISKNFSKAVLIDRILTATYNAKGTKTPTVEHTAKVGKDGGFYA